MHASRGGAERERDRGSEDVGLEGLRCGAGTRELRDHDLSLSQTLNQLSHPGAPLLLRSPVPSFLPVSMPDNFLLTFLPCLSLLHFGVSLCESFSDLHLTSVIML